MEDRTASCNVMRCLMATFVAWPISLMEWSNAIFRIYLPAHVATAFGNLLKTSNLRCAAFCREVLEFSFTLICSPLERFESCISYPPTSESSDANFEYMENAIAKACRYRHLLIAQVDLHAPMHIIIEIKLRTIDPKVDFLSIMTDENEKERRIGSLAMLSEHSWTIYGHQSRWMPGLKVGTIHHSPIR